MRGDADQAKDVVSSFGKVPGAMREKGIGEAAVRLMHKDADGAPTEWIFSRVGKVVLGIGDESRVLRSGMTAEELTKINLSKDEKISRLKKALGS